MENTQQTQNEIKSQINSSYLFVDNTFINYSILFLTTIFLMKLIYDAVFGKWSGVGMVIDISFFAVVYVYVLFLYQQVQNNKNSNVLVSLSNEVKRELDDFNTILYVFFVIVSLFITKMLFVRNNMNSPISINILLNFSWLYFSVLLIVNFFKFFFKISLIDVFNSIIGDFTKFSSNSTENKPLIAEKKDEVFNISNNLYTYEDAQNVCSVYGAKLATYDQIEQSYNNGAEWCSYGWSDGQMALFPTQKNTWLELQKNPNHKNDCGRPGVNGGYMSNPNLMFGVNCYGKKPQPTEAEKLRMEMNQQQTVPLTPEAITTNKKIEFWKENADKLLLVNSFNKQSWSQF